MDTPSLTGLSNDNAVCVQMCTDESNHAASNTHATFDAVTAHRFERDDTDSLEHHDKLKLQIISASVFT
jgi:hypothetical protein